MTGLYAVIGIQAALHQRQQTGRGQHVDLALFDVMVGTMANQAMNDNQTKAVFSTLTVSDPDTQDQFVRITITNGITRGDFTAASTAGWTRKVSSTNILYERFFSAAANNGSIVQAAIRARSSSCRPTARRAGRKPVAACAVA